MSGEKNLAILLKTMKPTLNKGDYVFCTLKNIEQVDFNDVLFFFREEEGVTVIVTKEVANNMQLDYSFVASWITLMVHSSLGAVGLTAAFSKALTEADISCNVIAAYFHDHIFVDQKVAEKAMLVLNKFSKK
jgi:uncharacterized protein